MDDGNADDDFLAPFKILRVSLLASERADDRLLVMFLSDFTRGNAIVRFVR